MVARSENLDWTVANSEKLDRTVENTTENSEKLDRSVDSTAANNKKLERRVEDKAANCLMLLSGVGGYGGENRVYRCKTCMKEFSSFQSLGGHRASHNKHVNKSSDEKSSLSSGSVTKKKTTNTRSHRCPICGVEFPLGQALGGHMRKHRHEQEASGGTLVTRSFFPEEITTLKKSSSGKRVACLDLGSDSMESSINLKLELGRTMY